MYVLSLKVQTSFSFPGFTLRSFANLQVSPKNNNIITQALQWTATSELLETSNRSPNMLRDIQGAEDGGNQAPLSPTEFC
jgi:hypothetical protein